MPSATDQDQTDDSNNGKSHQRNACAWHCSGFSVGALRLFTFLLFESRDFGFVPPPVVDRGSVAWRDCRPREFFPVQYALRAQMPLWNDLIAKQQHPVERPCLCHKAFAIRRVYQLFHTFVYNRLANASVITRRRRSGCRACPETALLIAGGF